MAKNKRYKGAAKKRDSGRFIQLPCVVLESAAYRGLNHAARSLLTDLAMQYVGDNNGALVACEKYLKPLGWKSNQSVTRALKELQDAKLIQQTRLGMRPNRAAWYALTWLALDDLDGMDITSQQFDRGSYRRNEKLASLHP